MANITIGPANLPFVLGGKGTFTVKAGAADPAKPLPRNTQVVLDVETQASGTQPVNFGGPGSWTASLKSSASVQLTALWPTDLALVEKYGLQAFFSVNPHDVVLLFSVGGGGEGTFAGTFRYGALTAGAQLDAGGDVSLIYARGCDANEPINTLLPHFFQHMRLPAAVTREPDLGEVIHFEYGGYLNFGAKVGVGYEMKGTPSLDLGQLRLAEHYDVGLIGSASLSAQIGGFFSVDIRRAADNADTAVPGWARVVVRRTGASEVTFAADASVTATTKPQKLPDSPPEFLGALLGVNVKNWFNLLHDVARATDWNQLTARLDDLAIDFLNSWFEKTLAAQDLPALLAKVSSVVQAYDRIDTTIITVVDRFFDKITGPAGASDVVQALETLAHVPSWDSLSGSVNPTVWTLLDHLTDGDPLGWILGKGIGELQQRAAGVLNLARAAATSDVGSAIRLAKTEFGIAPLMDQLRAIDDPTKLQAELKKRSGAFLERLLGPEIQTVSATRFGSVVAQIHGVLAKVEAFEQSAYDTLTDALTQSLSLDLHAEYSRASDDESLIDVLINATTAEGVALLHAAALGDFTNALDGSRPDLVRVNDGRLTRNLVKTRAVGVNVIGWHDGWHYKSVEQVIVHSDQQIVANPAGGGVTVFSTIDLTKTTEQDRQRVRKNTHDLVRTNFLLRFLGESHGILESDPAGQQYLIDTITRMAATYVLSFDDNHTTSRDLAYYLGFARDFGIVDASLQPETIGKLLPLQAVDDYGRVVTTYTVRYTDEGLRKLFSPPPAEAIVRNIMRKVVLASFLAIGREIADEGWAYATDLVYQQWKLNPNAFVHLGAVSYAVASSPFPDRPAPQTVTLQIGRQRALAALYGIEDTFVAAFGRLAQWIGAGTEIPPIAFQHALGNVGDALSDIDDFGESVNATFALFDALVMNAGARRASSLTLASFVAGRAVNKVFVSR